MSDKTLISAAQKARQYAIAPFSGFRVGAALETSEGKIYTGCNIENATLGLTICAERVALFKALSEGKTSFKRVCVVTDTSQPTPPCGACRQLLWEFGGNLDVLLADLKELKQTHQLGDLFPLAFDGRNLKS
ncbi:cytidine deaminase [Telmatocola sphagniphila]|uniref:Cytidine deaminase n=1 Tax=Telmatocola sphagniphila TaxID=1123043 RepID=A0A8E6B760_9BACT|nr:cytidine deaminase [Telmatocola sphagniphila]QVL33133.1 cytidine deaminase [Telmatocola sphagniphila]